MQPLISPIDHESRTSSHRAQDDVGQSTSEATPLLPRLPRENQSINWTTKIAVSLLLLTLLGGVTIGIYLLVLQSNADNILPPVRVTSVRYINRSQWDNQDSQDQVIQEPFRAMSVIIEQTDTRECQDMESCYLLLKEIKEAFGANNSMPYNFLVSSDGTVFEGHGWSRVSTEYTPIPALVVAFIGNFLHIPPPIEQTVAVKNMILEFVSKDFLEKYYTVIVQRRKDSPRFLYEKFKNFPHRKLE